MRRNTAGFDTCRAIFVDRRRGIAIIQRQRERFRSPRGFGQRRWHQRRDNAIVPRKRYVQRWRNVYRNDAASLTRECPFAVKSERDAGAANFQSPTQS